MNFRTSISVKSLNARIDHSSQGLLLGSCFAENMAEKMQQSKFRICKNPFGVIYNPSSICHAIDYLVQQRHFTPDDLVTNGDLWFSFSHHGSFAYTNPDLALQAMNSSREQGSHALQNADYVVLTFGTAWVYELADKGVVVANCHKMHESSFVRRRLGLEEIVDILSSTIDKCLQNKKIILTVSPIRHMKDGLVENSRSKAILIEACHRITDKYSEAEYFPSFEIMMDDLRDYRFYDRDMVHPSSGAVDYIWERFCGATMDRATMKLIPEIEQITTAIAHRPIHPSSPAFKRFHSTMLDKTHKLQAKYPEIDLSAEVKYFTI